MNIANNKKIKYGLLIIMIFVATFFLAKFLFYKNTKLCFSDCNCKSRLYHFGNSAPPEYICYSNFLNASKHQNESGIKAKNNDCTGLDCLNSPYAEYGVKPIECRCVNFKCKRWYKD